MAGLVDGGVLGTWQVVRPLAATNYISSPSFESNFGASAWVSTSCSLTSPVNGKFGVYSLGILATAQNGRVEFSGPQFAAGRLVVASVYMRADSPLCVLRLAYGGTILECAHPGDGLWHRLEIATVAVAATTPVIGLRDGRASAWTRFDVDGAQFEPDVSAATTYIDGDQDGCIWSGAPHYSTSSRDGRDGRGGQLVSLDSVGLLVTGWKGAGAPPTDVATQTLALGDGELYSRSTAKMRTLTLACEIIGDGTGLASWHTQRRTISDLFRPDSRTNRGPILLRYAGALVDKVISVLYQAGLEMDTLEGAIEKPEIKLLAPQPDWQSETDEQAALAGSQSITSTLNLVHRLADGTWSNLGGGIPSSLGTFLKAVKLPDRRLVVSGNYADMATVAANDNLAVWDGASWALLGGAAPNNVVYDAAVLPNGDLVIIGLFSNMAGIAAADGVAYWTAATNTWSALGASGVAGNPYAVGVDPVTGYIYVVGAFTGIGGVTAANCAYWNGTTWVAAVTGLPAIPTVSSSLDLPSLFVGPDGRMCLGIHTGVYAWSGTTWAILGGAPVPSSALQTAANLGGAIYAAGGITSLGGVTVNKVARWNGVSWENVGASLTGTGIVNSLGRGTDGKIYAASSGGVNLMSTGPSMVATFAGSNWVGYPIIVPLRSGGGTVSDVDKVFVHPDGSITFTWENALLSGWGTATTAPGVTTVQNDGSSIGYPVVRVETTGLLYAIVNQTTGQSILLNGINGAIVGPIVLDFRPGQKTIKNASGANLISSVAVGSDMTSFGLAPGQNAIAAFCTGTTTMTMYWRPPYWSSD